MLYLNQSDKILGQWGRSRTLFRLINAYEEIEVSHTQCWFWFWWWAAIDIKFAICRWYPSVCLDSFGSCRVDWHLGVFSWWCWFQIERWQNRCFDKRKSAATDPWYSNRIILQGVGVRCRPQMDGLQAACSQREVLRIIRLIFVTICSKQFRFSMLTGKTKKVVCISFHVS